MVIHEFSCSLGTPAAYPVPQALHVLRMKQGLLYPARRVNRDERDSQVPCPRTAPLTILLTTTARSGNSGLFHRHRSLAREKPAPGRSRRFSSDGHVGNTANRQETGVIQEVAEQSRKISYRPGIVPQRILLMWTPYGSLAAVRAEFALTICMPEMKADRDFRRRSP